MPEEMTAETTSASEDSSEESSPEVTSPEEESSPEESSPEVKEPKESPWNLNTVLLMIAVGALGIAILLMLLELSSFHFDFGANTAR